MKSKVLICLLFYQLVPNEMNDVDLGPAIQEMQPLLDFINRDISLEQVLFEISEEVKRGSWIGHVLKGCLSYMGVGESENIFVTLIHQSLSQDVISRIALNYRHMMGFNTPHSKVIAANGFHEIYQSLKYNLTMFDFVDRSSMVFHEKKDLKNVNSILFPSGNLASLIVELEESFDKDRAVKLFNDVIFSDNSGFYKQYLHSIIETLYLRGYPRHAQLFSNLVDLKYKPIHYWLDHKNQLTRIRNFALTLAVEGDVTASTIYAVTCYYLEDRNSTVMDSAFDYLLFAYNSKYKFSYFYMGMFFIEGIGFLNSDNQKGLHSLRESAGFGCLNALAYLAEMNMAGIGIFYDSESAAELYHMTLLHHIGQPFKIKSYEAIHNKKYTQALLNMLILLYMGDERQGYNAATLLRTGSLEYMPLDTQKRINFRLLKRSANIGLKDSWVKLADCYFYGNGVKQNYSDAILAYTKAFSNHDYVGAYSLGYMYQHGLGVEKDNEMAKYYYQESVSYEPGAEIPIYFLSWQPHFESMIALLSNKYKEFVTLSPLQKILFISRNLRKVSPINLLAVLYTMFTFVTICVVWKRRVKF